MRQRPTRAARMLKAKPTKITRLVVEQEIDRLWLRVQLRAAELGITQRELAKRMGIKDSTLSGQLAARTVSAEWFRRLGKALEGVVPGQLPDPWWTRPLPELRPVSARKVLNAVRRKMR